MSNAKGFSDAYFEDYAKLEKISSQLLACYQKNGCEKFAVGGVDADKNYGAMLSLRPDITLAVAKAAAGFKKFPRKLFYTEKIYKINRSREVVQSGVEFIGVSGAEQDARLIGLAIDALLATGLKSFKIELAHSGFLSELLNSINASETEKEKIISAINLKDVSAIDNKLVKLLTECYGGKEIFKKAAKLCVNEKMKDALSELESVYNILCNLGYEKYILIDLAIIRGLSYYTGVVFTGITEFYGTAFLAGGRYDNLIKNSGKNIKATGFAIELSKLALALSSQTQNNNTVNIALAKGRLGERGAELLSAAGIDTEILKTDSRKLIFETADGKYKFFLVKPADVPTYVEMGIADLGFAGKDTIVEEDKEIYEAADLKYGACRMCICGYKNIDYGKKSILRVATKYVNTAKKVFSGRGRDIEIIKLSGSVELAPLINLSDIIVDVVESGGTLKANGLSVLEELFVSTARLIVNKVSFKTKSKILLPLIEKIRGEAYENS